MQYIKYLQKRLPQAEFTILNVGSKIKSLENNIHEFEETIKTITQSDGVIWGFPLYYLLVSSQMKRFIELIHERNAINAFRNKPAAVIATSIHFCDNIAINYIKEVSEDLGMNFFDYYSADMLDLNNEKDRARLTRFGANFLSFIQQGVINHRQSMPLVFDLPEFKLPEKPGKTVTTDKKVVILTDENESDKNLHQMTLYLKNLFGSQAEVVNLHEIKINGGCLGCIRCAYDFNCVYDGHDDYHKAYEAKVATADIIIYAGSIRDRYLSSKWKQFFDRSFFNNHTPLLIGKQVGMVISGPFRQMDNLKNLFQNYFEVQKVNQAGVVSDDLQDSNVIETGLINLAEKLVKLAEQEYVTPQTFLGVAGKKLFRDEVYGRMRFPFIKDYQSYKKRGNFDFPQKEIKTLLMNYVLIFLSAFPKPRKFLYTKGIERGVKKMYKEIVEPAGAYYE
jgi:multimeric flavodoxin WrbA